MQVSGHKKNSLPPPEHVARQREREDWRLRQQLRCAGVGVSDHERRANERVDNSPHHPVHRVSVIGCDRIGAVLREPREEQCRVIGIQSCAIRESREHRPRQGRRRVLSRTGLRTRVDGAEHFKRARRSLNRLAVHVLSANLYDLPAHAKGLGILGRTVDGARWRAIERHRTRDFSNDLRHVCNLRRHARVRHRASQSTGDPAIAFVPTRIYSHRQADRQSPLCLMSLNMGE